MGELVERGALLPAQWSLLHHQHPQRETIRPVERGALRPGAMAPRIRTGREGSPPTSSVGPPSPSSRLTSGAGALPTSSVGPPPSSTSPPDSTTAPPTSALGQRSARPMAGGVHHDGYKPSDGEADRRDARTLVLCTCPKPGAPMLAVVLPVVPTLSSFSRTLRLSYVTTNRLSWVSRFRRRPTRTIYRSPPPTIPTAAAR